jgi:hypothetical protein
MTETVALISRFHEDVDSSPVAVSQIKAGARR